MTSEQPALQRGLLIILSGPSGVGKDTLINAYLHKHENATASISFTTRPPRSGEQEGVNYFYITREEFLALKQAGDILEDTEYEGNLYGTPRQKVEENLARGKHVFLIIEVDGAKQIRSLVPEAVGIFIVPPSFDVLRQRLFGRGAETEEEIEKRIQTAKKELPHARYYDYIIQNYTVEQALALFETIVIAAEHSPKHNTELLKGVADSC